MVYPRPLLFAEGDVMYSFSIFALDRFKSLHQVTLVHAETARAEWRRATLQESTGL